MIYILGNGCFARELRSYYEQKMHGLSIKMVGDSEDSISIADYMKEAGTLDDGYTMLGSGKPEIKKRMFNEIIGRLAPPFNLSAFFSIDSEISFGSVLAPGSIVSCGCFIGSNVLINYSASIGHDTTIDDFSSIGPNASIGGNCVIGNGAYIGAGANVRDGIIIGDNAIVGMGAVVTKDVESNTTVYGVPAKIHKLCGGW